jgi:hypothetical protein
MLDPQDFHELRGDPIADQIWPNHGQFTHIAVDDAPSVWMDREALCGIDQRGG